MNSSTILRQKLGKERAMNWLVGIGLFALVGICSYFGIEHHLDSKANR